MLFPERYTGLVRLADAVKLHLESCGALTDACLTWYSQHQDALDAARSAAKEMLSQETVPVDSVEKLRDLLSPVPEEDAVKGAQLRSALHTYCLTTVLACCFSLESYINALAYHLFSDLDLVGKLRTGREVTSEILLEANQKMSTRQKWKQLSRLGGQSGFDTSRPPYQDFISLFNFRDDLVHDKPVPYGADRSQNRYQGRLPDPVLGHLDLTHALFAANTYWAMVTEILTVLSIDPASFHRHYNLAPWREPSIRERLHRLAQNWRDCFSDSSHS